jgi:hypothetical protein
MANQRNDAYHEIENRQAGRMLLKKEWKWTKWFIYLIVGFMILYGFMPKGYDYSMSMVFSQPLGKNSGFTAKDFDYITYFPAAAFLAFVLFGIVYPKSYEEKIREKQLRLKKRGQLSIKDKAELKIWKAMDKLFYWLGYGISMAFFYGVQGEDDKKKVYMKFGWLSHLERNFFKQEVKRTDGYNRVSKLNIMKNYPEYFSKKSGVDALTANDFVFLMRLFKSSKEMKDLMLISEGFVAKGEPKFDRILSSEEFKIMLQNCGGIDNIRMFNGKDEVLYSHDTIKALMDVEAQSFEKYIRKYAFDSRMLFTRRFQLYAGNLKNDINAKKYLFVKGQEKFSEQIMADNAKFMEYLVFVLVVYFRFVLWKVIIGQYVNLPAGTIVVKQRDYAIRMITESFDDKSLINIAKNKNDGSTDQFESDNLVNLFLASLNHYRTGVRGSFEDRVMKIFNFGDVITAAMEEEEEKSIVGIKNSLNDNQPVDIKQEEPVAESFMDSLAKGIS